MDRATFAHSLAEMRGIFIGEIMTNDDFNKLLGITESYKIPDRLMEIWEYPKDCVNLCTNVRLTYEYGGFLWPDEDQIHRKRLLSEK